MNKYLKHERGILVSLYEKTNGNNWGNRINWLTDRSVSEWYGISTNPEGRIYSITLPRNFLKGELPESINELRYLKALNLAENKLSGKIIPNLDKCTLLHFLKLSDNEFEGGIPDEIYNLTELTSLDLTDNKLFGQISPKIANLKKLKNLRLGHNQLSGNIPEAICELTELLWLELRENVLTGKIPDKIGNLSKLRLLTLKNNKLGGDIPLSMLELKLLDRFWGRGNDFTVPKELEDCAVEMKWYV